MRKLLNTLYITTENTWLSLDGENLVANLEDGTSRGVPLHNFESIVAFTYKGASPALLGKLVEKNISFSSFSPHGRFLFHLGNDYKGNVILRRRQYRISDNEKESLDLARNMISGKIHNSRQILMRHSRNHGAELDDDVERLKEISRLCMAAGDMKVLRGLEGNAAQVYFSLFDGLILRDKQDFFFHERIRRPPTDRMNAMLSFSYTLLSGMCEDALRTTGLDPYVGFMHTDRSGRASLALDLMEELRPVFADRFVLNLVNNRIVSANDFNQAENGAVMLKESARNRFLDEWQKRKREEILHPYIKEKIPFGLVPQIQAMLLAKAVRGDLDGYPAFLWR